MGFYTHVTIRISKGRTAVIVLRAAYSRGTTFIPRDWDWWYVFDNATTTAILLDILGLDIASRYCGGLIRIAFGRKNPQ